MATPVEHEQLYGTLRARILARYFAIGRYFRTNFPSLSNELAPLPDELNHLPEETQKVLRRWNVKKHGRENPLMVTGQLSAMLSIEHHFGHPASGNILKLGIETIGTLYRFQSESYGLPVRWDPVTSDVWIVSEDGRLAACREFLVDDAGAYQFCVPATDPRHVPFRALDTLRALLPRQQADAYWDEEGKGLHHEYFENNLVWETSMDELTGLVAGYSIAHRLLAATRPDVDVLVVNQARKLADTMAGNGYLLLRPCGGLNARGSTGALPAMEHAYVRAFLRITGESFPSRLDFVQAMQRAGYWRLLEGPVNRLVATAYAGAVLLAPAFIAFLGANGLILGAPVPPVLGVPLSTVFGMIPPHVIGTALALFLHSDTFDVSNEKAASEVSLGYIFKQIDPVARFQTWMTGMRYGMGQWAKNFPPFLALAALDDPDPVVRDADLTLYANSLTDAALDNIGMNSAFSAATAVLMGGDYEDRLLNLLNNRFDYFNEERDLHLDQEGVGYRELLLALDYLSALALAWLHAERRGAAITVPEFPVPPQSFATWPAPTVPAAVLEHLPEVRNVVFGSGRLPREIKDVDLFAPQLDLSKPAVPQPLLPPRPTELIFEREYTIRPGLLGDLHTGVTLKWGDEYEIEAEGEIWAGDITIGNNGPEGVTDRIVDDARWPLHSGLDPLHAFPFALLGRLGGWFYVGRGLPRRRYLGYESSRLFLRINDNSPGDGNGSFRVRVRVWGDRIWGMLGPRATQIRCIVRDSDDPDRRIDTIGGVLADGTSWRLSLDDAVAAAKEGHEFFAEDPDGHNVSVVVATRQGRDYLRTVADGDWPNNLLALPDCR